MDFISWAWSYDILLHCLYDRAPARPAGDGTGGAMALSIQPLLLPGAALTAAAATAGWGDCLKNSIVSVTGKIQGKVAAAGLLIIIINQWLPADNSHVHQIELDTVWIAALLITQCYNLLLTILAKFFYILGLQGKFLFCQG